MKVNFPIAATLLQAQSGNALAGIPAWKSLRRLISQSHVLALLDQAVVSATSFVTLIIVARWTDPAQLGAFAIGMSMMGVLALLQHSLVSLPYSIQRHSLRQGTEHACVSLIQSGLFCVAGLGLVAAGALALAIYGVPPASRDEVWALAGLMPFFLIKEFARDFEFAHLRFARALKLDLAVTFLQLFALGCLAWTGRMSTRAAYEAMSVCCAVPAGCWLYVNRSEFEFRAGQVRKIMKQSWDLGKWLFVSNSAGLVQGYATHWLSMLIAGAAVTGIYAACMSIVSLANPLLFGLYNVLTPKSILTWKHGGGAGLWRQAIKDVALLGALMGSVFIAVVFVGDNVMSLLYPGNEYQGHARLIAVLAFATVVSALALPAANGLAAMERPRPSAAVAIGSAVIHVVLVWWMMTEWGLLGAAYAVLAARIVGTLGRWIVFLMLVRKLSDGAPMQQRACAVL